MVKKVFGVFDAKAGIYLPTVCRHSKGEFIREMIEVGRNKDTMIGKFPADFTLFELGEWDDLQGEYSMLPAKQPLGTVLEWISKEA